MAASGSIRPSLPHSLPQTGGDTRIPLDPFGAFVAVMPGSDRTDPPASGPLAGLEIAVKDLLVYGDRLPSCGLSSPPFGHLGSASPVVTSLVGAGARIAGFTALTALAYEPSGINADGTRPLNPWRDGYVCGGSSSGSAVAVAAGLVPLALGSDTAGSLRIPAQCSGVASWKPTFGLLPLEGVMPLAPSLDCLGFLAREIDVLERVAALFAAEGPDFGSVTVASDLMADCVPEIAALFEVQRDHLAGSGLALRELAIKPLLEAADGPVFDLLQGEAYRSFQPLLDGGLLPPDLARRLQKGQSVSDEALVQARDVLAGLHEQWSEALFGNRSFLLLPVMPVTTPAVTACTPGHADFAPRHLYALSAFTRFVNGLGLPAVAVPLACDVCGLPMAMQLVGPKGSDRALLAMARGLEAARGDFGPPPLSGITLSSDPAS